MKKLLCFFLSLLTPVWLVFQRKGQVAQVSSEPPGRHAEELEPDVLNEKCGHDDRTIPLDPGCPKCHAILKPCDLEFINRQQVRPLSVPVPVRRRAFQSMLDPEWADAERDLRELERDVWMNDPRRPALNLAQSMTAKPVDPQEKK